ncbi:MAG: Lrp/AsnC family transcriptional regulator [Bacteroidia bacterium]|jgi:Lrp/AsnC family leucine-responsive transcriptional regulator|nr:Lrp/AsnC family transcriptional regulator [Bacteroidia bacterium]
MKSIDEVDKLILSRLQQNNRITAEELATKIGLSTSAVQRRIKRLRDEKIIIADISIISPEAAGAAVTCIADVTLHLGNSTVIDRFKKLMYNEARVMQCYYVTGSYDFVVIVNTRDMKEYEEFSKKYFMDNTDVKQFYTHVIMDNVKVGYGVNLNMLSEANN